MSIFALYSDPGFHFFWILIAPVSFPAWVAIGFLFIGNSELPADPSTIMLEILIFLVLFAAAIWWVRLSVGRLWLSLATIGAVFVYLVIAAICLA
jgi:hypothetical protein